MPMIYVSRPSNDRPFEAQQASDADDSIYLSDIVRSGEASRLRRRGAMRLDPTHMEIARTHQTETQPNQQSNTIRYFRQRQQRDSVPKVEEDYHFALFCGAELLGSDFEFEQETEPFVPPPLPWGSGYTKSSSSRRYIRRSNGCGALVHTSAAPHQRLGVWTAKSSASDSVIPMDPMYFDSAAVAKIVRSSCGCVREGVGCAIWYVFTVFLSLYLY